MKKILFAALLTSITLSATAAEKETIRFATEATYPPFEMIDANNKIVGFDVDLANAMCEKINAECTFTNQSFDSLIPSLKFRRFEALMLVSILRQNVKNKLILQILTMITLLYLLQSQVKSLMLRA